MSLFPFLMNPEPILPCFMSSHPLCIVPAFYLRLLLWSYCRPYQPSFRPLTDFDLQRVILNLVLFHPASIVLLLVKCFQFRFKQDYSLPDRLCMLDPFQTPVTQAKDYSISTVHTLLINRKTIILDLNEA